MNLTYDFSALWNQVNRLKGAVEPFIVTSERSLDPIDVTLGDRGIEVKLDDLDNIGDLLSYKGRQVLLYIPDQGHSIDKVLSGDRSAGKKFHISHCKTLDTMRANGRFERYFAITNLTGSFPVGGVSRQWGGERTGEAALNVCINCLNHLNYKNSALSSQSRYQARDNFDISEFFETYSSCFKYFPQRSGTNPGSTNYTSDWKEISERIRRHVNWCCDDCGVNLSDRKYLLHVHHKDGNKTNNTLSNLRPLCAACHRDQPMHEAMFIKYEDMTVLARKRREQDLIKLTWESALKHADAALRGVLELARNKGWSPPEISYAPSSHQSSICLDVAWPNQRLGISLGVVQAEDLKSWRIWSLREALSNLNTDSSSQMGGGSRWGY